MAGSLSRTGGRPCCRRGIFRLSSWHPVTSALWMSPVVPQDRRIARLLMAGEPEGLRRLFVLHGGRVREVVRFEFPGLDCALLDDVMSLAALRIWRARHRFTWKHGSLRAWLLVIARRCALRHLAAQDRERVSFTADLDGLPAPAHEIDPMIVTVVQDVRRCIGRLPKQQRVVLLA